MYKTVEVQALIDRAINDIVKVCNLEDSFNELDMIVEDLAMDLVSGVEKTKNKEE